MPRYISFLLLLGCCTPLVENGVQPIDDGLCKVTEIGNIMCTNGNWSQVRHGDYLEVLCQDWRCCALDSAGELTCWDVY